MNCEWKKALSPIPFRKDKGVPRLFGKWGQEADKSPRSKVSKTTLEQMKTLRLAGKSYVEIGRAVGVAKTTAIHYLRDLRIKHGAIEEEWKKAEKEAVGFLKRNGFSEIHDLNAFSPSAYWDLLAKRDSKWWLVDVTVSATKQIGGKIPSTIEGYVHAILYKNIHTSEWKLVRIILEEVA